MLVYHKICYQRSKAKLYANSINYKDILEIKGKLNRKRIPGFKLNNSLESILQNYTGFHMFIEFADDCKRIQIVNRKPLR